MSESKQIKYYNSTNNQIECEKIYGDKAVRWLYHSLSGRFFSNLITGRFVSSLYGKFQDTQMSAKGIPDFIKNYAINISEFEKGSFANKPIEDSYRSFNEFFIRRFKQSSRVFNENSDKMAAFCEARYLGFERIDEERTFPVKGVFLKAKDLLGEGYEYQDFIDGPLMIARLCPVDYHRYHYPDNGKTVESFVIKGQYHSVNPIALKLKNDIFIKNQRRVSLLETQNFGKLAFIEVGATCVGKIVQSFDESKTFKRGDEKGYFLFGGSTVILMGQKGKWKPSELMLENTHKNLETFYQLGSAIAEKV